MIVVTDGSRVLGLGDQGADGMGIPIGKALLYVLAGGFDPATTLAVTLDFGTSNKEKKEDESYIGDSRDRPDDPEYYQLVAEFVRAAKSRWQKVRTFCVLKISAYFKQSKRDV